MVKSAFILIVGSLVMVPLGACATADGDSDRPEGPPLIGDEAADGMTPVEVVARLGSQAPIDGRISGTIARAGYIVYAKEGTSLKLEVTRSGSSTGLDTVVRIYGPRKIDGSYPASLASDDDSGYAKLSLVNVNAPAEGFYLVEVTSKAPLTTEKKFRLALSCTGTCDSDAPVAPIPADLRWITRSAEAKAAKLQVYAQATERLKTLRDGGALANDWGVVLDCDETVLDNSTYQRERAELGVGYSSPSWTAWTQRREAGAISGAVAFTNAVHTVGGRVVFVTNRKSGAECTATQDNLHALGFTYDGILCKTGSSDKNARFQAVEAGTSSASLPPLDVALYIGDNIQDFPDLGQDIRHDTDSAFTDFGTRFFLVPNPMYGSWETNAD